MYLTAISQGVNTTDSHSIDFHSLSNFFDTPLTAIKPSQLKEKCKHNKNIPIIVRGDWLKTPKGELDKYCQQKIDYINTFSEIYYLIQDPRGMYVNALETYCEYGFRPTLIHCGKLLDKNTSTVQQRFNLKTVHMPWYKYQARLSLGKLEVLPDNLNSDFTADIVFAGLNLSHKRAKLFRDLTEYSTVGVIGCLTSPKWLINKSAPLSKGKYVNSYEKVEELTRQCVGNVILSTEFHLESIDWYTPRHMQCLSNRMLPILPKCYSQYLPKIFSTPLAELSVETSDDVYELVERFKKDFKFRKQVDNFCVETLKYLGEY